MSSKAAWLGSFGLKASPYPPFRKNSD